MKKVILLAALCLVFLTTIGGCGEQGPDPAMKAEIEKLKVRNSELDRENEKLRHEINEIATERNEWRDKHNVAQVKLDSYDSMIQKMKVESVELKARLDELEKRNALLEADRTSIEGKLKGIEGVTVERKGDEICVTVDNVILFDSGKAELKDSSLKAIKALADVLVRDFKGRLVRIEGHTDTDPIKTAAVFKSNWELSTARACAVLHQLAKFAVEEKTMFAAGYAFYRPVAPNDTPGNKAKNRRVEIYIKASK